MVLVRLRRRGLGEEGMVRVSPHRASAKRSRNDEVNTFGAWRLAALGSGDASRYTHTLSL